MLMKLNLVLKAYVWLIETIRDNGPITLSELDEMWRKDKLDNGNELGRQRFFRYRNDISETFGVRIAHYSKNEYYIENPQVFRKNSIENWLLSVLSVYFAVSDCLDIKDRIGVENIPSSEHFLMDMTRAMKLNHTLQVTYQAYGRDAESKYTIQPYFVQLYHQRWYVIGPSDTRPVITLALDRMKRVRDTEAVFLMDGTLSVYDYLKDCYGVMKDDSMEVEDILIRAYGTEVNCLRDLPLHGSQREVNEGRGWADFKLRLKPSWDFIGKLMERGNRLKVLEPASVMLKLWAKHVESVKLYEEDEESLEP